MNCPSCNFDNRVGAKLCGGCGGPLMGAGVGGGGDAWSPGPAGPGHFAATVAGPDSGGPKVAGAAASTVFEGGGAAPSPGGAGRTIVAEDEWHPIAGWLVVLRSPDHARVPPYKDLPLHMGQNRIGRNPANGSRTIDDDGVSSDHAIISAIEGPDGMQVAITDVGSKAGVAVNNQRVTTAVLSRGDMVRLGRTTMVFVNMPVRR